MRSVRECAVRVVKGGFAEKRRERDVAAVRQPPSSRRLGKFQVHCMIHPKPPATGHPRRAISPGRPARPLPPLTLSLTTNGPSTNRSPFGPKGDASERSEIAGACGRGSGAKRPQQIDPSYAAVLFLERRLTLPPSPGTRSRIGGGS